MQGKTIDMGHRYELVRHAESGQLWALQRSLLDHGRIVGAAGPIERRDVYICDTSNIDPHWPDSIMYTGLATGWAGLQRWELLDEHVHWT